MVQLSGYSVYKSSKICGVPTQTLRDRVLVKVKEDIVKSGPKPVLSCDQENMLAKHITEIADNVVTLRLQC